jgi:hypothetical protein
VPTSPLPDQMPKFLAKPNPTVITTPRPDGQPVSVATWYLWDGGCFLVDMDEGRKRLDYQAPRMTLTVLDEASWYTQLSVQGRVVEMRDDAERADADRVARRYVGRAYPVRDRRRVTALVEVERWHGWGAAAPTSPITEREGESGRRADYDVKKAP